MRKRFMVAAKLISEHSFRELDFVLEEEFAKTEKDEWELAYTNGFGKADGYPISIDKLIQKLEEIKKSGATHVEMESDTDHYGYRISAYEIEPLSKLGIKEYLESEKKKEDKMEAILKLKAEIRKIEESE
jgi:hypothetical protein